MNHQHSEAQSFRLMIYLAVAFVIDSIGIALMAMSKVLALPSTSHDDIAESGTTISLPLFIPGLILSIAGVGIIVYAIVSAARRNKRFRESNS